jgi:hypothetical protein
MMSNNKKSLCIRQVLWEVKRKPSERWYVEGVDVEEVSYICASFETTFALRSVADHNSQDIIASKSLLQTPEAQVEFELEQDLSSGSFKAHNVTAPGGQPIQLPKRRPSSQPIHRAKKKETAGATGVAANPSSTATTKPRRSGKKKKPADNRELPFHATLPQSVREQISARGIDLEANKGTLDIALGDARIKLGLGSYAGYVHKDGIVAEGTYSCDDDEGVVTIAWERAIQFHDNAWKSYDDLEAVLATVSLTKGKRLIAMTAEVRLHWKATLS